MTTSNHLYPQADIAWFAVDADGSLAAFITAGFAPVPKSIVASRYLESMEQLALKLPEIGTAHIYRDVSGNIASFVALAKRGFYVFDWRDAHRSRVEETKAYELILTPDLPLRYDALVSTSLEFVELSSISFIESKSVQVHRTVECVWPANQQAGY